MKRNSLSFLLALITLLTACAPIQKENPIASTSTVEGTQAANPEKTPMQGLPEELTENRQGINLPVTVSFVKNQWSSDTEIITVDLIEDFNYPAIPVKSGTVLKSLPAIDQDGNVFLLYGANATFFSKLSPDGNIETINLPNIGPAIDSVWIGNRLFINRENLLIVSTDMSIEEQPAINTLPYGNSGRGFMGLANETEKSLVWFARKPLREGDKLYAFYRTYDVNTGETYEEKLEIPYSNPDYNPTGNPTDRLGTMVMGVDTASKHVLLCYVQYPKDENSGYSNLELYDPVNREVVSTEQLCCINTVITSSGAFYSSYGYGESGDFAIVRRYSDGSDVIDFSLKLFPKPSSWHWHGTNGDYWIVMDPESLSVLDNSGIKLYEYTMPEESFKGFLPPESIIPAFLISQE
jgi:hypothetical protein